MSFLVPPGKKVGLVGPNGAGKSTLFKLLTREEFPVTGKILQHGSLMMVPQEVQYDPALVSAATVEAYIDPHSQHSTQRRATVLAGLEFDRSSVTGGLAQLSGGQKTKLALARAFLAQPDVLLLDEPTNFLDEAGKRWVMEFLAKYPKSVLIVSHDLALLDRHISQVLYLNPQTHTLERYSGNYSAFLKTKRQRDEHLKRQVRNEQQHLKRMEGSVQKLRRLTSDKGIRQRVMLERRIQRIKDVLPEVPRELRGMKAAFPAPLPVGSVPLWAKHVGKSFDGHVVLRDVTVEVRRGEKLVLIGPNGVGKTTLIKMLVGELLPDSGEIQRSESVNYGYYSQEHQTFDNEKTLEQVIIETDRVPANRVVPFLGRFLFPHERLHQRIGTLSGGEKTRLAIALLMLQQHNLLILDEPTTYLDVMSQRIILEALKAYQGAIVLVSHTKEFVQELQPERALLLPSGRFTVWTDELADQATLI